MKHGFKKCLENKKPKLEQHNTNATDEIVLVKETMIVKIQTCIKLLAVCHFSDNFNAMNFCTRTVDICLLSLVIVVVN